jgi:hypothetical protein
MSATRVRTLNHRERNPGFYFASTISQQRVCTVARTARRRLHTVVRGRRRILTSSSANIGLAAGKGQVEHLRSRVFSHQKGRVERILTAAAILSGSAARSPQYMATPYVLRRVKRLIWFALVACMALIGALQGSQELPQQLSERLALAVILVASWAIVLHMTVYLRAEDARRAAESEAARLEGARMTANAMQDRIANKLSLTVGYTEFLVTDARMPEDLREHAQRAMDGARAAAEQMSELKRLTRQEYQARLKRNGAGSSTPGDYDSDRLRRMISSLDDD